MVLLFVETFMFTNEVICVKITVSEDFIISFKTETANFQ